MKKLTILITLLTLITLQTQRTLAQWYKQTIPVNKQIYGIKFIDTSNGWACTDYGTQHDTGYIIHTSNGGKNWYIQYKETHSYFTAISVINNNIVYVAGLNDTALYDQFLKTTNGGLNWTILNLPTNMSILDMQFLNIDSGWECNGGNIDVRTTTDGGLTWTVRTNGINDQTQKIFFLNYNTGFVTGNVGELWKTTNAGLNWNLIYNFTTTIGAVFFLNEQTGWTSVGNYIDYTSNGGTNWINQVRPPASSTTNDICFLNSLTGYASEVVNERVFKTTNGGQNWGYQHDTGSSIYLSIIDSSHGWTSPYYIIGADHTTNGGGPITYVGIINISNKIPENYKLYQNYPNPFNPSTNIRFSLIKPSKIQLKIYDVSGKEITLWNSEQQILAGTHEIKFDGSGLASGVYFYQLIVTDLEGKEVYREARKMILLK